MPADTPKAQTWKSSRKTGAYVLDLPNRVCGVCTRSARHEAFNRYNATMGFYCTRCAIELMRKQEKA